MKPTRKTFDLSLVADRMTGGKHAQFVKAVRVFHAACSVALDLRAVRLSVDELIRIDRAELSPELSHLGQALLTHAVINYARATHSQAITRFNVGVTKAYDARQRSLHNDIIVLRDKCLAHFGTGDLWHDERVLYLETDQGKSVTTAHRRINYRQDTIDALDELLDKAIPFLKQLQSQRADDLNSALQALPSDLNDAINKAVFEPIHFFGGDTEAHRKFWDEYAFYEDYTKSV